MLAAQGQREDVYVLADPRTLLCPQRLRSLIDSSDGQRISVYFCSVSIKPRITTMSVRFTQCVWIQEMILHSSDYGMTSCAHVAQQI